MTLPTPRLALAACLAALLWPAAAAADFEDGSGSPHAAGAQPFAVAVDDFDGDGRRDIATASETSGDVTILLGQNGGGYAEEAGSPIAAGSRPADVAAADLNGDDLPDLAVANFGSDDVTILLRRSGGGFTEAAGSPISVGHYPSSLAAADFDGDHQTDLAVVDQADNSVTILLRQAGGGFAPEDGSPFPAGAGAFDAAAADFDGDGDTDLVISDYVGDSVTVLLRRPGGGFAEEAGSPIAVGVLPLELAAKDLDGDGRTDLAVANHGSDTVTVLLRQAGGGFAEEPGSPVPAGDAPYGIAAADLDRDGRPDLAVTDEDAHTVTVLRRQPPGGFAPAPGSPFATGGNPLRLVADDLDRDGRTDLAVPLWLDSKVSALLNVIGTTITAGPGKATNDATPAFAFSASESPATFECRVDGAAFAPCASPFTTGALAEGEHAFAVRAIDDLGNPDPTPAERAFTVDLTPPETTITAGPEDGAKAKASPTYEFASSEPDSTFGCGTTAPLGHTTAFACASPATLALTPGTFIFSVAATDAAGNTDPTPASRRFTLLPPPPALLTAPAIVPVPGQAHDYRCDPGVWIGRDPAIPYTFTWVRLTPVPFVDFYTEEVVAHGETFRASAPTKADMYAKSWRFRCDVEAASAGGTKTASSPPALLDPVVDGPLGPGTAYGNFRIRGIDVFQAVQPNAGARAFNYDPGVAADDPSQAFGLDMAGAGTPTSYTKAGTLRPGANPQVTRYQGVPLDDDMAATAVVYVDMQDHRATNPGAQLEVELSRCCNDKGELYDARTPQVVGERPVTTTAWVTTAERENPLYGVQFALPPWWLEEAAKGKRLDLVAEVRFANAFEQVKPPVECESGGCAADDRFRLNDVAADRLPSVVVMGIGLREASDKWVMEPWKTLAKAREVLPGGNRLFVTDSGAYLNINDIVDDWTTSSEQCKPFKDVKPDPLRACRWAYIDARMDAWAAADHSHVYDVLLGVHDYGSEPGWTHRRLPQGTPGKPAMLTANNGSLQRPLTAAAHELGHVFDLDHAGRQCPVPVGVPGNLTGAGAGQTGEKWPGDDRGRLQSVRFDRAKVTGGVVDPSVDSGADPAAATAANPNEQPPLFGNLLDLMSYCNVYTTDPVQWLSARNWNHAYRTLLDFEAKRASAAVAHASAAGASDAPFAAGVIGASGGRIDRVTPPDGDSTAPAPMAGAPVRLRSLDASGRVLLDAGVAVEGSSEDASGAVGSFIGPVARGAAAVELVRDGAVLHRLERTEPPAVRVLAPARSRRVGGRALVRWSAADPDGGELTATVDYSADGGRTWSRRYQGPNGGRAVLTKLPGSRRARIRVGVSDGFSETRAVSPRFRAAGTPPTVQIMRPAAGEPLDAGTRTRLEGTAADAAGRPLRALTWYAGRRRLGQGAGFARRLPAGNYALRLVARDRGGRIAVARLPVRVPARRLRLVRLAHPATVGARARRLPVTIAASEPATLRAGGHRYRVGTRARRVMVALPARPRRGALRIPCRLVADGAVPAKGTMAVRRG